MVTVRLVLGLLGAFSPCPQAADLLKPNYLRGDLLLDFRIFGTGHLERATLQRNKEIKGYSSNPEKDNSFNRSNDPGRVRDVEGASMVFTDSIPVFEDLKPVGRFVVLKHHLGDVQPEPGERRDLGPGPDGFCDVSWSRCYNGLGLSHRPSRCYGCSHGPSRHGFSPSGARFWRLYRPVGRHWVQRFVLSTSRRNWCVDKGGEVQPMPTARRGQKRYRRYRGGSGCLAEAERVGDAWRKRPLHFSRIPGVCACIALKNPKGQCSGCSETGAGISHGDWAVVK